MKHMLQYRGYLGSVQYSPEDGVYFGKVESIRSLITFESAEVSDLQPAFNASVEDYLETCSTLGRKPETPVKAPRFTS